jgi:N-acetyl-anhydromuramyl-L-alanine amidase AmpD
MNIIGEGFPKEITGQVKTRQEIYGSINRTTEQLEYLNSRTAFARLVSSVNITDKFNPTSTELKGILNKIGGNKLAQEFVLINGTSKAVNLETTKGETTPRSGIARDGSILNMNAYGLGGLEFGLRAMPGITGADVKTENRGSLRTTTIQIKAWNRVQFEIIDLLYLRLGYSVLFEFGNTIYFENEGKFIRNRPNSLQDGFLNGDYTTQSLLQTIQALRLASEGNYDAVFGKVVNFSWSFETDGSYNITLTIRSIGDVIESLKINTLLKDVDIKGDDKKEKTDEEPTIESYKDKHQIGRLLYNAKRALAEEPYFHGGSKAISTSDKILTEFPGALLKDIEGIKGKKHFLQQNYLGGEPQYYIRLGSFLAFLEQKVIPKYVKNNVVGDPIIKFDYKDDNYIHQETFQISMDPRVCLVKATIKYDDGTLYYYAKEGEPFSFSFEGSQVGSLMNIYVNFMYILTKVDENLDEDNKCKLIDLLKSICNGINESTGSINQLEPIIDDEINTIKIIDQTSLPTKAKNGLLKALNIPTPDESPILDLYSYNRDGGGSSAGFVRNFGFKTEITPQLATMLTIGAQAAGSVVGEDATSISKLNEGLIDRIKEEVIDANSTPSTAVQSTGASSFSVLDELKLMAVKFLGPGIFTTPVISSNSKTEPLDTKYPNALKNFSNAQKELGSKGVGSTFTTPTWDEETIDTYRQAQVDFFKYSIAKNSIEKSTSSVTSGFIPISLNLTLDGISGIKIYNTLRVDTSYLPSNYPGAMDFIITGLSHKINSNVWTTDITSLMVPKDPVGGTQITDTSNSEGNNSDSDNSGGNSQGKSPKRTSPSEWNEKTITSGFALNPKGHSPKESDKTQIVLHYSAGWQKSDKGLATLTVLNQRGLSYHYIIDVNGWVEQIVPDRVRAYHSSNANTPSIGISLQNVGYGSSETKSSYGELASQGGLKQGLNAHLVDWDGNETTYRNIAWAQEITDAQLASLFKVFKNIKANNPTIPSYKWEGKKTYDILFPKGVSYIQSTPGLYTHCSITTQKLDCLPTPKIIKFFKTLVL